MRGGRPSPRRSSSATPPRYSAGVRPLSVTLVLLGLWQGDAPVATCRSVGADPARTWRFEKPGARWQVSHWRGDEPTDVARVLLPASAEVAFTTDAVHVRGKTSNGGIDVTLEGTPQAARLDIYVSYELEVNVDTSLTPKIDDLNTEGLVAVRCEFP